jgi:hypothetical protein
MAVIERAEKGKGSTYIKAWVKALSWTHRICRSRYSWFGMGNASNRLLG